MNKKEARKLSTPRLSLFFASEILTMSGAIIASSSETCALIPPLAVLYFAHENNTCLIHISEHIA